MIILSTSGIKKSFGTHTVLEDGTLTLQEGERLGLVGANGSGKTTFFRMLLGEMQPDSGTIAIAKGTRVGHLAQQTDLDSPLPVWDYMLQSFEPLFEMERRMREIEQQMADHQAFEQLASEYSRLTELFEHSEGYSWKSRLTGVLSGLKFSNAQFEQPVRTLSGGEKTRLSLARLLISQADLLLLDEPTNHLDLDMLSWLESFLQTFRGTVLVVSHDRYFLDALCTGIAELCFGRITQYSGNFTRFREQRDERFAQQLRQYTLQQREIARQQAIIARFRQFNREKSIRAAESREKALDRMELLDRPRDEQTVRFCFHAAKDTGNDVLMIQNVTHTFGERTLFPPLNLHLRAGDRVALVGPNGIGKSTLLKLISRRLRPQAGSITLGTGVTIGYYDQHQSDLDPNATVLEEVRNAYPQYSDTHLRNVLASFLFIGDEVFQPIHTLSGGEKGRASLVKLMLRQDNMLLLDEPTNHLDMDSCSVLEDALEGFEGTLLFVSHDRYFINRIATRVIELTPQGTFESIGNYDAFVERKQNIALLNSSEAMAGMSKTAADKAKKRTREATRRIQSLREECNLVEKEILDMEQAIAQAEARMADPETYSDAQKAQDIARQHTDLQKALPNVYERWERLQIALEEEESQ